MILRLCSDTHGYISGPDTVGYDYGNAMLCDHAGSVMLAISPPETAGSPQSDPHRSDLSAVSVTAHSQIKERFVT